MPHINLFVVTPPYSGSTLLTALLGTAPRVSILPSREHEGMKIPELMELFPDRPGADKIALPWHYLDQVYRRYWDLSKTVLVEKGQYLRQAPVLQELFPEAYFICMQRDPYAWCESLLRRRKGVNEDANLSSYAANWLRQAAWLLHDLKVLNKVLHFTYEDLCDRTGEVLAKLKAFMPELDGLDPQRSFDVHSTLGKRSNPITNTNAAAIARLSAADIAQISDVLSRYPDLLEFFGYKLR
jgi:hypothetical protein